MDRECRKKGIFDVDFYSKNADDSNSTRASGELLRALNNAHSIDNFTKG